jgi:putative ABC transport system permease protein
VLMSRSSYERHWDDRGVTSVAAYLDPGADAEEVAAGLRRTLSEHGLGVVSNRALRENALRVFDRTFAVTQALRALAVIVAFVGVWSALMALQVERTRELATLSALGVTPGELLGLTLLETGLMGLTAGLIALPTGVILALILVEVINVRSFGWTMALQLAPRVFLQALAVSVVAALLAAFYPLRRLRRLPVAAALRTE